MDGYKNLGGGKFEDKNGNGFSLNKDGKVSRNGKLDMKDNPNYKKGFMGAQWSKFRENVSGLKESSSKSSFNETDSAGDDISTNKDTNNGSDGDKKNVSHSNPSNKDTTIIPENSGNVKPLKPSIAQQIDYTQKYNKKVAEMKETFAHQNALNGGGTETMHTRQKMQLDALEGAYNMQMGNAPKVPSAPKGFFSSRIDSVKKAFSGSGSIKRRMALAGSAALLGTASETFANTMDAIDPMSYAIGSPLGQDDAKFEASMRRGKPAPIQSFNPFPPKTP